MRDPADAMRERRRRHDDVHYPLQGRGKRAVRTHKGPPVASLRPMRASDWLDPYTRERLTDAIIEALGRHMRIEVVVPDTLGMAVLDETVAAYSDSGRVVVAVGHGDAVGSARASLGHLEVDVRTISQVTASSFDRDGLSLVVIEDLSFPNDCRPSPVEAFDGIRVVRIGKAGDASFRAGATVRVDQDASYVVETGEPHDAREGRAPSR